MKQPKSELALELRLPARVARRLGQDARRRHTSPEGWAAFCCQLGLDLMRLQSPLLPRPRRQRPVHPRLSHR